MNFGNIGGIGSAITGFLSTPEGPETVKKFLSSPDGIEMMKYFAATPDWQKVILSLLPQLLGSLNLPPGTADMIKYALVQRSSFYQSLPHYSLFLVLHQR